MKTVGFPFPLKWQILISEKHLSLSHTNTHTHTHTCYENTVIRIHALVVHPRMVMSCDDLPSLVKPSFVRTAPI